ncbi:hypothetical protein [Clostridium thermobutyricum]|uniref:hypothetical protein n=1 Tax=Clostridium thermobutyricum TaxID=29372 RepID=UPI0018AC4665|nr:hypothetical protein [Clostridium thermobutyricum]
MKKIITIIVGIIIVCGIGIFAIISSNKKTEVNKVVASNKISPEANSLKSVKPDSEKNINTNISKETSNKQSIHIKHTKATTNQKDVQTGENVKVIDNQNINKTVKQSNQKNNDIKHSNDNITNRGMIIDNLINNLYVSSWHQIRAIDKSFDKNGVQGGELFSQIQMAVNRLNFGVSDPAKYKLKAEVVKTTEQNSSQTVYTNLGNIDSNLKGYFDEIKPV